MKSTFFAPLLLASAAAVSMNANAVSALPLAYSSFDWNSFTVQVTDINPMDSISAGITWTGQSSDVGATNGVGSYFSSGDWTSHINADDGNVHGLANAYLVQSSFTGSPVGLSAYSYANRSGDFTLTAGSAVTFTVDASTHIDLPVPINGQAYSWATFDVEGTGVNGILSQHATASKISWASLAGPASDSGTLQITFLNFSNSDISGRLSANTTVNSYGFIPAVPEPETYAMLLAGLGLMGFIARRRMK